VFQRRIRRAYPPRHDGERRAAEQQRDDDLEHFHHASTASG
jgi:hypothetical protein